MPTFSYHWLLFWYMSKNRFVTSDLLGSRLESEGDETLAANACLCYICAGNLEKLVSCLNKHVNNSASPAALQVSADCDPVCCVSQDLVDKVMILYLCVS